jgi:hypothetical protein
VKELGNKPASGPADKMVVDLNADLKVKTDGTMPNFCLNYPTGRLRVASMQEMDEQIRADPHSRSVSTLNEGKFV